MTSLGLLLCRLLVKTYPTPYRQRFGGEVVQTYALLAGDRAQAALLLDLCGSVVRQWFRPENWQRTAQPAGTAVLGSVLNGEYPGVGAGLPSPRRLTQAILVLAAVMGIVLNIGARYRSLLRVAGYSPVRLISYGDGPVRGDSLAAKH